MSEFISLEDLKGMSSNDLADRWMRGSFPFELLPGCSRCVTMHNKPKDEQFCPVSEHKEFSIAVGREMPWYTLKGQLAPYLESIYSLRLFYQHLYADNPPEIMDATSEGELQAVTVKGMEER